MLMILSIIAFANICLRALTLSTFHHLVDLLMLLWNLTIFLECETLPYIWDVKFDLILVMWNLTIFLGCEIWPYFWNVKFDHIFVMWNLTILFLEFEIWPYFWNVKLDHIFGMLAKSRGGSLFRFIQYPVSGADYIIVAQRRQRQNGNFKFSPNISHQLCRRKCKSYPVNKFQLSGGGNIKSTHHCCFNFPFFPSHFISRED